MITCGGRTGMHFLYKAPQTKTGSGDIDEWNPSGKGEPELRPLHPFARSLLLWSLSTCRALIVHIEHSIAPPIVCMDVHRNVHECHNYSLGAVPPPLCCHAKGRREEGEIRSIG